MPVYATRRLRNLAAALLLVSGTVHLGQLWIVELDAATMLESFLGVIYFLIGLGVAGRSRFSLWLALGLPALVVAVTAYNYDPAATSGLVLYYFLSDIVVIGLCSYVLYRTRHADMD